MKSLSRVRLFAIPWTVAHQAPQSIEFSRQECWSGLAFPSPGGLPNPGIEPRSLALQADALPSEPPGKQLDIKPSTYPRLPIMCFPVVCLPAKLVWRLWIFLKKWSIVDFWYYVNFKYTAKWFQHIFVCIYILFLKILFHYSLLQDVKYSFLCYTVILVVYFIFGSMHWLIPYS